MPLSNRWQDDHFRQMLGRVLLGPVGQSPMTQAPAHLTSCIQKLIEDWSHGPWCAPFLLKGSSALTWLARLPKHTSAPKRPCRLSTSSAVISYIVVFFALHAHSLWDMPRWCRLAELPPSCSSNASVWFSWASKMPLWPPRDASVPLRVGFGMLETFFFFACRRRPMGLGSGASWKVFELLIHHLFAARMVFGESFFELLKCLDLEGFLPLCFRSRWFALFFLGSLCFRLCSCASPIGSRLGIGRLGFSRRGPARLGRRGHGTVFLTFAACFSSRPMRLGSWLRFRLLLPPLPLLLPFGLLWRRL